VPRFVEVAGLWFWVDAALRMERGGEGREDGRLLRRWLRADGTVEGTVALQVCSVGLSGWLDGGLAGCLRLSTDPPPARPDWVTDWLA
jgi:hypothetical protein